MACCLLLATCRLFFRQAHPWACFYGHVSQCACLNLVRNGRNSSPRRSCTQFLIRLYGLGWSLGLVPSGRYGLSCLQISHLRWGGLDSLKARNETFFFRSLRPPLLPWLSGSVLSASISGFHRIAILIQFMRPFPRFSICIMCGAVAGACRSMKLQRHCLMLQEGSS